LKEIYDIVVIGGGTNGLSIACYLAKCGLSVCICEDRAETGGGVENIEPMPGFRIDPHATYLYGAAAPAFEQLELHKFGFRMIHYKNHIGGITSDGRALMYGRGCTEASIESVARFSKKDAKILDEYYTGLLENPSNMVEYLRSIYWTPPPPPHITLRPEEFPWSVAMKKQGSPLYDPEWNRLSTMELLDMLYESEAVKLTSAMATWYNGPHPCWKGTAIPGMACNDLLWYGGGKPRGGMHSLTHALVRCALHHGVKILTNTRVEEIIMYEGEARGVILSDQAPVKNKKIYANQAVISNAHVKPTFLDLVPAHELNADFIERVKGINLKGGSLYVLHIVTTEMPKFIGEADEAFSHGEYPTAVLIDLDSRESMYNMERDVYALNTHPIKPENMLIPFLNQDVFDETCCPEGYHVFSPIYLQVPPPEDHRDGPRAVNDAKEEINQVVIEKIRRAAPNLTDDKIVATFANTPYDSSLRNLGFVGGNWMGISQEEEQWYEKKPLPELARYRTPIPNLYLCHQTSYPGGLALQAVSYNLMHILIEDLKLQPGEWWYPSEYFIPSDA